MICFSVPGWRDYAIDHLVFDVNGTLAVDGQIDTMTVEKVKQLKSLVAVHLITADTYGKQHQLDAELGLTAIRLKSGNEARQKADLVKKLGPKSVAVVGNGANDIGMFQVARLSVMVIGPEGANASLFKYADLVTGSIPDALDLFLNSRRLVAALRR